MTSVDPIRLRHDLAAFLGPERFSTFARQGIRRGRFRYWQDEAWRRFVDSRPEYADASIELIEDAIRVCHVHGCELEPDAVGIIRHDVYLNRDYERAHAALFPNAFVHPMTVGPDFSDKTVAVWFCSKCREAEKAWGRNLPNPPLA